MQLGVSGALSFGLSSISPLCGLITLYPFTVEGHLSCSQFRAIMNSAAINILYKYHQCSFLQDKFLEAGCLSYKVIVGVTL